MFGLSFLCQCNRGIFAGREVIVAPSRTQIVVLQGLKWLSCTKCGYEWLMSTYPEDENKLISGRSPECEHVIERETKLQWHDKLSKPDPAPVAKALLTELTGLCQAEGGYDANGSEA